MKVEEFAIGMGPKIYSWMRNGIVYSIRWIPAGGFVKLPQMITSEALEGQADSKVPPAPPLQKILVAVAGPCMNVIFAFVVRHVDLFRRPADAGKSADYRRSGSRFAGRENGHQGR